MLSEPGRKKMPRKQCLHQNGAIERRRTGEAAGSSDKESKSETDQRVGYRTLTENSSSSNGAGEAKNIPPYPGPNKMRDCYCTVNLDQEEVFRTKIVEKSLCPFYGEDFYCEIPRSFRHLSFYIFDRDVFRRDSSIGKKCSGQPEYCIVLYCIAEKMVPLTSIHPSSNQFSSTG
uniref:C2 domain-containing protein n=1 Tax=Paramormyrops kingsleyae TaxID=1676925 RepID=A0A3B3S909_9TELE